MSLLKKLFAVTRGSSTGVAKPPDQAVLVHLDGAGLPPELYKQYDLSTLEDQLTSTMSSAALGEFDGNEVGPARTTLYMYGPGASQRELLL